MTSPTSSPSPAQTFQIDSLPVRVYNTEMEMAQDVAAIARDHLRQLISAQGSARVILATGNSQIKFLEALINLGGVEWSKLTLFHMDEYLGISPEHPASFRKYMRERVEARVRPGKFHYLEGDALQPLEECARYTQLLNAGPIDLCCLGIGENGHIAFNDPPVASFEDTHRVKLVKLDEACRQQQVGEGHFPSMAAVPQYAFTLTIPMLCSARRMLCVAPEERKASAVHATLRGPISTACPASILRRLGHATLFLDKASASRL